MKNLLLLLGWSSLIAIGCSSSSRTGYTYYDDVYDNRPSYSNDKRKASYSDDRPSYQEPSPTYNKSSDNYENRRYIDDESSSSDYNGSYSDRIRRFSGSNSGFDYYSPYYSGYNDGFSSGFGMSSGYGYSSYGSYRPSFWNPFYSSSISFGWGMPSIGFGYNSWRSPSYYNPYYSSYNPWDWGNSWYSPYNNYWGSSSYYGGSYNHYDRNPVNNNSHYGPRGSSYGNSYYNGNQNIGGGKLNNSRGPIGNTPQSTPINNGSFNRTPKSNNPPRSQPTINPNRENTTPRSTPSVPERYQNNSGNERNSPSPSRNTSPSNISGGSQKSGGTMQRTNK